MKTFQDKVCVVTGAASGIGMATAELLARQGGTLVLADLADASDLAERLGGTYVRTDVSDPTDVEQLFTQAAALHGQIDVLVNNAGIFDERPIDQVEATDFGRQIDVNAIGILHGVKYGTRVMTTGGAIVNTASIAGRLGMAGYASYAASKAAAISLTMTAAIEYGPRGIRVNCICPSSVETPMLKAQENGDLERQISRLTSPLGTTLTAEQVADIIGFLASPASSALTGQALNVDAGMSTGYSSQLLQAISDALGS